MGLKGFIGGVVLTLLAGRASSDFYANSRIYEKEGNVVAARKAESISNAADVVCLGGVFVLLSLAASSNKFDSGLERLQGSREVVYGFGQPRSI